MVVGLDGLVVALSYSLLSVGPSLISAPEVSLFLLLETVLAPLWVWLAGFEAPPKTAWLSGGVLLVTLSTHSILAIREEQQQQQQQQQPQQPLKQEQYSKHRYQPIADGV